MYKTVGEFSGTNSWYRKRLPNPIKTDYMGQNFNLLLFGLFYCYIYTYTYTLFIKIDQNSSILQVRQNCHLLELFLRMSTHPKQRYWKFKTSPTLRVTRFSSFALPERRSRRKISHRKRIR